MHENKNQHPSFNIVTVIKMLKELKGLSRPDARLVVEMSLFFYFDRQLGFVKAETAHQQLGLICNEIRALSRVDLGTGLSLRDRTLWYRVNEKVWEITAYYCPEVLYLNMSL